MAKRKKRERFSAVKEIKAMARERIGTPRASKVVPDKKKKLAEKHKSTLEDLLERTE